MYSTPRLIHPHRQRKRHAEKRMSERSCNLLAGHCRVHNRATHLIPGSGTASTASAFAVRSRRGVEGGCAACFAKGELAGASPPPPPSVVAHLHKPCMRLLCSASTRAASRRSEELTVANRSALRAFRMDSFGGRARMNERSPPRLWHHGSSARRNGSSARSNAVSRARLLLSSHYCH
jgi:hypothetical protein